MPIRAISSPGTQNKTKRSLRTTLFLDAFSLLAITVILTAAAAFFLGRNELRMRATAELQSAVQGRESLLETTIAHTVLGRFGAGLVLLKPAPQGTGVIAGGPVRAVITSVGIPNVLTKSIGSHNPHNVVKATIDALEQLRDRAAVADMRGLAQEKV